MACFNKVGTVLRQSISISASNGQSSMFINAIRCMSTKIFVGGLSYGTDDQALKEAFSNFGDVDFARVITDRETGRSKGYGFVNFTSEESASSAISAMNGQDLNGRSISVSIAQERAPRNNFGGGYGGRYGNGGANDNF